MDTRKNASSDVVTNQHQGKSARFSKRFDDVGVSIAQYATRHPWLVLLMCFIVVGVLSSGVKHLAFSDNYRVFFSDENPELMAFEKFQDNYSKNDNILIVIHPKNGTVFTPSTMSAVEGLTDAGWKLPFSSRVDSVTNFQNTWSEDDDLIVEDLIVGAAEMSNKQLQRIGDIALAEPLLNGSLLNADATVTAVNITFQFPQLSLTEVPDTVAKARELVAQFNTDNPDLEVYITGLTMMNNAFAETGQADGKQLMPIMFAVLLLMIFIILRSVSTIIATLLVIIFSTFSTLGFAGFSGVELTPISMMAPIVVMTLAIADSIHILLSMVELMRRGMSKVDAIIESVRINFQAVTLTSLTTMIGFLALNYSDAPPFWHLGNMTAFGILIAFLASITALPAVMRLLPLKVKVSNHQQAVNPVVKMTAQLVTRHYKPVLVLTVLFSIGMTSFISRNEINDSFVRYFDESIQFRTDTDFTTKHLSGGYSLEYSFDSLGEGGINETEYLRGLEDFTDWLRIQPEVDHVASYSDIIKRLNKNMHSDEDSWYRIPEDRDTAAQYLLLYEMSLPFGLDMNNRITMDKSASRLTVTLGEMTTVDTHEFIDRADNWIKANLPHSMQSHPTGATVMFSNIFTRNTESMLSGNVLAIGMITLILMLSLGSLRYGLLSIIPNTIPILITFGIWGVTVGEVGLAAAGVSATALGIIVDDTVHFLTKFLRARREYGYSRADSVHYAFNMVGSALLANSVILIAGFAVLAFSAFKINNQMGMLTGVAIAVALIMDFLLLPALLMLGSDKEVAAEKSNNPKSITSST